MNLLEQIKRLQRRGDSLRQIAVTLAIPAPVIDICLWRAMGTPGDGAVAKIEDVLWFARQETLESRP